MWYDFLIIGTSKDECQVAYDCLAALLLDFGFQVSETKLVPPTQCITFLGIEINSLTMTLSLLADKLSVFQKVTTKFLGWKRVSKQQLQRLAIEFNWTYIVTYGGRNFLHRILDLMNTLPRPVSRCHLTTEFQRDLEVWPEFLDVFNGQGDFFDQRLVTSLQTNACTIGLGAFLKGIGFTLTL